MLETKLIKTLRTLNRKELNDLPHFYKSNYFNSSEKVATLLDLLLEYKPGFDSDKLEKEKVFKKLFNSTIYDDTKMRLLISDALKVVSQFISINKLSSDPLASDMLLLDHFSQRENNETTLKRFEEFRKKLETQSLQSAQFYYWLFRLEELKNNFNVKRAHDYDLNELFTGLEGFYLLNKLKMICIRLSHHRIFRKEVEPEFLEEINQTISKKIILNNPVIEGYLNAINLLLDDFSEKKNSERLFELLHTSDVISPADRLTLSKIFENYCIRQMNAGDDSPGHQLFQLLDRRLNEGNSISSAEVKTFVTLSLRLGKHDEIKQFLLKKREQIIPIELRDDVFNYSMALLQFYQKNYNEVLRLLQQVEYLNIFYKLGSKKLLIKTYYELEEWDSLDSAMNAFRVFIHRNEEISDLHKKNNQHFINFLYKLVGADSINSKRVNDLTQQLRKTKVIAERQWLHEKLKDKLSLMKNFAGHKKEQLAN